MQILPHPALAHLVRHYLILDELQPVNSMHRLFADGNTGLVFNLDNAALCAAGNSPAIYSCWLYGQVKTFHNLSVAGSINWIVVVLQPYGAHQLWGVPAMEWYNCFFPAVEIVGTRIDSIANALLNAKQLNERIRLLDNFLLQQVDQRTPPDPVIVQAVQHIIKQEGMVSVESLHQSLWVNERTLERKFKLHIGISPKRFTDIVRLNSSAKRMQRMKGKQPLTGVAYESGYFDQAHFIKEFKKYTGITPQQYQAQARPLALNFLEL
ncbi:helix-turn-helix transcriptional regulator [Niastella caeni]|uniref:Helix-turn-helix transcriptional regulator n=1 Tax=Niastella caeni TaxID=2569763 RepID=A0A4S8HXJ3_9BACT|nr:helix-turn-helix transcriptional regulator [Niastella caeni]THU40478.1 helix-turn-helix transcriptional regulator [Niastella caeni]